MTNLVGRPEMKSW